MWRQEGWCWRWGSKRIVKKNWKSEFKPGINHIQIYTNWACTSIGKDKAFNILREITTFLLQDVSRFGFPYSTAPYQLFLSRKPFVKYHLLKVPSRSYLLSSTVQAHIIQNLDHGNSLFEQHGQELLYKYRSISGREGVTRIVHELLTQLILILVSRLAILVL